MNLNFTISELIKSQTAKNFGISNIPNIEELDNLLYLIFYILQPIRDKFGAIIVTSGYRCPKLNMLVNGAANSNHLYGQAVDIIPKNATFKQVYSFIINNLDYDECFIEKSGSKQWLHIAYRREKNRKKHSSNYLV